MAELIKIGGEILILNLCSEGQFHSDCEPGEFERVKYTPLSLEEPLHKCLKELLKNFENFRESNDHDCNQRVNLIYNEKDCLNIKTDFMDRMEFSFSEGRFGFLVDAIKEYDNKEELVSRTRFWNSDENRLEMLIDNKFSQIKEDIKVNTLFGNIEKSKDINYFLEISHLCSPDASFDLKKIKDEQEVIDEYNSQNLKEESEYEERLISEVSEYLPNLTKEKIKSILDPIKTGVVIVKTIFSYDEEGEGVDFDSLNDKVSNFL